MPCILEIVLPIALDTTFEYLYEGKNGNENGSENEGGTETDNLKSDKIKLETAKVGQRVLVDLKRGKTYKESIGFILAVKTESNYDLNKLRPIKQLLDGFVLLDESLIKFYQFASRYYAESLGMVIKAALPVELRQSEKIEQTKIKRYQINTAGKSAIEQGSIAKNATKQLLTLQTLIKLESPQTLSELKLFDIKKSDIDKAIANNYIKETIASPFVEITKITTPNYQLNDEQTHVIGKILTKFNQYRASLVYGITGSGKTEVYMRLIENVCKQNKQTLLLVPEISLTPQMLNRFKQRFGHRVAALHSGLTKLQRKDIWLSAKTGDLPILIGTRSAIFTAFNELGLILIDEEHDSSYKQQDGFRYNARDLAFVRASSLNIPLVMGSATPSLEMLHNVDIGKVEQLNLTKRASDTKLPEISIIDTRGEAELGVLTSELINKMRLVLANNEQVMLFLNKRGFAPVMICTNCKWSSECHNCSTNQTAHINRRLLICHHCGNESKLPIDCPSCHKNSLQFIGAGTEKLEQKLNEQFPQHQILRLDRDKQTTSKQLDEALSLIYDSTIDIVLGTQLLVKGHHFPNMNLVCAVDSDAALYSSDFRAEERLLQQLIQVAGRAGRETNNGNVFIQTAVPAHPVFKAIVNYEYMGYAQKMLKDREENEMPPYTSMALINGMFIGKEELFCYLRYFKDKLLEITDENSQNIREDELEILGPASAAIERKNNKYHAHLVLIAKNKKSLQKYIPLIQQLRLYLDKSNKYKTRIDIDPYEMS